MGVDEKLQEEIQNGEFEHIRIAHFVFSKPWRPIDSYAAVKVHFINAWREFVVKELGEQAYDIFEDVSAVRSGDRVGRAWRAYRKGGVGRLMKRARSRMAARRSHRS